MNAAKKKIRHELARGKNMDEPVQRRIEPFIQKLYDEGAVYVEESACDEVADFIGHNLAGVPDDPEAVRKSVKNSCRALALQGKLSKWKCHREIAEQVLQVPACPVHRTRHTTWTPGATCWQGRYKESPDGQILDTA